MAARDRAAEADAEAARHVVLERHQAARAVRGRQLRGASHHRRGAAGVDGDVRAAEPPLQERGDETAFTLANALKESKKWLMRRNFTPEGEEKRELMTVAEAMHFLYCTGSNQHCKEHCW